MDSLRLRDLCWSGSLKNWRRGRYGFLGRLTTPSRRGHRQQQKQRFAGTLDLHLHQQLTDDLDLPKDTKSYYRHFGWSTSKRLCTHYLRNGLNGQCTRPCGSSAWLQFRAFRLCHDPHRSRVFRFFKEFMMTQAAEKTCAHPNCTCSVSAGEKYCSQACSDAAEGSGRNDRCACPHPQCASAMAA